MGPVNASASVVQQDQLGAILSESDTIMLEENENVLTVAPRLYTFGAGDTLHLVDRREAQVRLYDNEGSLLSHFGGRGSGPTELLNPVSLSLRDGRYLVANIAGQIKSFSARGDSLADLWKVGLTPLYRHLTIDRNHLLLVGSKLEDRKPDADRQLLHSWNVFSEEIERSFFVPPDIEHVSNAAAASIGWAGADLKGDTIAAIYALSDTIYLFTTTGERIEKIDVSPSAFEYPSDDAPSPRRGAGAAALEKWTHTFTRLNQVFWVRENSFLVTYISQGESGTTINMVWLTRDGTKISEVMDVPRYIHVSRDGRMYGFPSTAAPNRLLVGQLKIPGEVDE